MSGSLELKPELKYEDLSNLIELALLAPELSESDVAEGCEQAKRHHVAAVIVRPCDVDLVARWLAGSSVALAASVDIPFGYSTTSAKVYAVRDVLRRGVKEVDTAMNTGKLISRQFQYLETELVQMADACHSSGAILKVSLESEYLDEELKIVACRIAKRAGADFVAGRALDDIVLLKNYGRDRFKLKAGGSIDSLQAAVAFREAGCGRIQSAQAGPILDAWKAKLAEAETQAGQIQTDRTNANPVRPEAMLS